jgi:hypothetical protein
LHTVIVRGEISWVGHYAFAYCTNLQSVCLSGNAPKYGCESSAFSEANKATVYYCMGTTGWGETFGGRPTALWPEFSSAQTQTGGLTLHLVASEDQEVVVEVCTNLLHGVWTPIATNTVPAGDLLEFTDPDWEDNPSRYYKVVIP